MTSERDRERTRAWVLANPERVREYKKKWRAANPYTAEQNARRSEQTKAWRAANSERVRETTQQWVDANRESRDTKRKERYDADPERWRAAAKATAAANPERTRANLKAWNEANPEHVAAYRKKRYAANAEEIRAKSKAWAKANPVKRRKTQGNRRARIMSRFVESVDLDAVFIRDGGVCQICDTFIGTEPWHGDHRIPLSKGGEHSYANVQLAHAVCNLSKHAKVPA